MLGTGWVIRRWPLLVVAKRAAIQPRQRRRGTAKHRHLHAMLLGRDDFISDETIEEICTAKDLCAPIRRGRSSQAMFSFIVPLFAVSVATPTVFEQRAVLNRGDPALLQRIYDKLSAHECIRVLAIGGSVTCGADLSGRDGWEKHIDGPDLQTGVWPVFLEVLH